MDDETLQYLEEIKELATENNKILKNLQQRARIGFFVKILYWAILAGIAFGAFYFIQPYIEEGKNAYKNYKEVETKVKAFPTSLEGFFKQAN